MYKPKQLTTRTYKVVVRGHHDPCRAFDTMWRRWHPSGGGSFIVTHGDVREEGIHLLINYTVHGGAPYDVRRRIGAALYGRIATLDEVEVQQITAARVAAA